MKRDKLINIRVNEEEHEKIKRLPNYSKKIRNFLRAEIENLDKPLSELEYEELILIRRQLQGAAANFNQLVKLVNATNGLSEDKEKELVEISKEIRDTISGLNKAIKVWEF